MSAHFTTPTDELLLLAETLGEVKTKADKLEAEFATQARPLEAATNALSAALSGIKALQFHVLDNNLGQLSARVEEMRKAVDEQVGVIALELKKADETNAAKAGQEAEALRSEIAALQAQLGTLGAQFSAQLERVEFSAKEEAKKLQLIPGPAGAAGASLNPRGTFVDGETYNRLDVVSWLGSSYIAAVDGVTEKPSRNSNQWQVLASRGGGAAGGAADFGSLAGVAQINQGGTGQTTRAAGLNALLPDQAGATQYMLLTDGAGNVSWGAQPVAGLPSQTSNSGKLLTTDGTNASWSGAVTVSGSNATVGGTLTVAALVTANGGANVVTSGFTQTQTGNELRFSRNGFNYVAMDGGTSANIRFLGTTTTAGDTGILNLSNTQVAVLPTTASTTTSTGALVVGNGTSGGLGVGGAITLGSSLTSTASDGKIVVSGSGNTTGTKELQFVRADGGDSTVLGLAGSAYAGVLTGLGNNDAYLYTSSAYAFRIFVGTTNRFDFTATQFKINPTTASTSTSSGALVVSGGVGVAGAIFAGGGISTKLSTNNSGSNLFAITRADGTTHLLTATDASDGLTLKFGYTGLGNSSNWVSASGTGAGTAITINNGVVASGGGVIYQVNGLSRWYLARDASTSESGSNVGSDFLITAYNDAGSSLGTALTIKRSDYAATFGGSIKTAAPSGGTAANWKLGTVASVSPTSPNRTIEVDIGGTIYYIHAKTTNN